MVKPDYTVHLERVFQGPMDLLLHLVREQEVDIQEIEIARILDAYLAYIESLEELDVEYAGDFLVMAATLMAIKSRSLLPAEEVDLEEELDPRDELIQRLVEYRRFKGVADELAESWRLRERQAERSFFPESGVLRTEREYDLSELTPFDLASVYARLQRETLAGRTHHVAADPRPLRFYVDRVVETLRGAGGTNGLGSSGGATTLRTLMAGLGDLPQREALVGSFCALLELTRLQVVVIEQAQTSNDIEISLRSADDGAPENVQALLDAELPPEVEEASETDPEADLEPNGEGPLEAPEQGDADAIDPRTAPPQASEPSEA